MDEQSKNELLRIAQDTHDQLSIRIKAIQKLGLSGDTSLIGNIKSLFKRIKTGRLQTAKWDPVAAERVIDLYLIDALHNLGDNSETGRIGLLVSEAGTLLQEPEDELTSASIVIRLIMRREPVKQLIDLTISDNSDIVVNALTVLDRLNLSHAPVGGSTDKILPPDKYTFQFNWLRQEIDMLIKLGKGKIHLSPGVKAFIKAKDIDRGNVKLEDRTLRERVERDLAILDFDYYLEKDHVVICTHQEAGKRWREWWSIYHDTFKFK